VGSDVLRLPCLCYDLHISRQVNSSAPNF
jgi:hypothetical protein